MGGTRTSTSKFLIFFLFDTDFENINHNKIMMMMMFLDGKEFALYLYGEERAGIRSRAGGWKEKFINLSRTSNTFRAISISRGKLGN